VIFDNQWGRIRTNLGQGLPPSWLPARWNPCQGKRQQECFLHRESVGHYRERFTLYNGDEVLVANTNSGAGARFVLFADGGQQLKQQPLHGTLFDSTIFYDPVRQSSAQKSDVRICLR
jgi:hypothetical protein